MNDYLKEWLVRIGRCKVKDRTKKKIKWTGRFLFFLYIVLLIYLLFFSERYGRSGTQEYRYNVVLFSEIKRFFKYRHLMSLESFVLNMFGNVVGFMPFGFFIPMLIKKHSFWRIFCLSFELTLAVEVTQLALKVGIFDVDDLFLNTIGGILGYVCYRILHKVYECQWKKKTDSKAGLEIEGTIGQK